MAPNDSHHVSSLPNHNPQERGNDAFRAQDWPTAIKEYEEAIKVRSHSEQ